MKKLATLIITITLLSSFNSFAQRAKEMNIYNLDQTQIQVNGNFVYENDYIKAVQYDSKTIGTSNIDKVIVGSDIFVIKKIENKNYLFQEIIKGTLSLYKSKSNYYLENEKHGLREIPKRNSTGSQIFNSGTVSLYINNCITAVNELSKRADNLTLQYLKPIVATYNSCDLQEEIQISNKVIEESMRKDGKIQFGLTAGFLNLNTDYSNLIDANETTIGMFTLGGKLYFHTNWLKKHRIDFNFSVDYAFAAEQVVQGGGVYSVASKTSFVNGMFGVNYVLSDLNSMFKPYLGISAGLLFDSGSEVKQRPNTQGLPTISFNTKSQIAYNLNVGTVVEVFNQEIDFLIAYQPKLDMPLTASSELVDIDTNYSISGLNFRLTYMF